jgi:predicted Zn-dependent peptidase
MDLRTEHDRILPNGLRYILNTTTNPNSEVCLMIPVGENHELPVEKECAHACEHIVSIVNPAFSRPYGLIEFLKEHHIKSAIETHEDFTKYHFYNIPSNAMPKITEFIIMTFRVEDFWSPVVLRELEVIHTEVAGLSPSYKQTQSFLQSYRDGNSPQMYAPAKLEPPVVHRFYQKHYDPHRAGLVIYTPESQRLGWDRLLLSTSPGHYGAKGFVIPRGFREPINEPRFPEGTWNIPYHYSGFTLALSFPNTSLNRNEGYHHISAAILNYSRYTRLETSPLLDYLRVKRGICYKIDGMFIRGTHNKEQLLILTGHTQQNLTPEDVITIHSIIQNSIHTLPGRNTLANLVDVYQELLPKPAHIDCMKLLGISYPKPFGWDDIQTSVKLPYKQCLIVFHSS